MGNKLRHLAPSEAFDDAVRRSFAAAAAGFLVFGALHAGGALPTVYRESLLLVSGISATFFVTLTLLLAYYHHRWKLGASAAVLFLILPFAINLIWATLSAGSLIYSTLTFVLFGGIALGIGHRRISGSLWDGDIEDELIKELVDDVDSNFTWKDRVIWICFSGGIILALILLLR